MPRRTIEEAVLFALIVAVLVLTGCGGAGGERDAVCGGPDYAKRIARGHWHGPIITYALDHTHALGHDREANTEAGVLAWQQTLEGRGYVLQRAASYAAADIQIKYATEAEIRAEMDRSRAAQLTRGPLADLLSELWPDTLGFTETDINAQLEITHARTWLAAGMKPWQEAGATAHEVGHALFCRGHSPCGVDLMYSDVPLPPQHSGLPGDRDKATLSLCYPPITR